MNIRPTVTDAAASRPADGLRATVPILRLGLVASVLTILAVVLDQALIGSIASRVEQVYRGSGVTGSESWVVTYLLAVGAVGVLGWLWAARGAGRGWRRVRPLSTVLLLLGLAVALLNLTVTEYGSPLVPTWLGLLGLVPSVVGLVAVVRMWRA